MSKRTWITLIALVASLLIATTGTLAYLTDTDSDVNVMTLGNVDIDQIETNEAGEEFRQNQPLFPAYYPGDEIEWDDELVGEIEKYVDVENVGESDAYARTWVAFEKETDLIHIKWAEGVTPVEKGSATIAAVIDGELLLQEYDLYCVTYPDVLKPGKSYSVLEEIAMDKTAGNDYVASFGDSYDVLVLTQAVQTANLEALGAEAALDEAFTENHPWGEAVEEDIASGETLKDALDNIADKDAAILNMTGDLEWATGGAHGSTPLVGENDAVQNLVIDGNGNTLVATGDGVGPLRAANGGTLTFKNMTIKDESVSYNEGAWELGYLEFGGDLVFENVNFVNAIQLESDNAKFINCTFNSNKDSEYAVWVCSGNASFEGCTFTGTRGIKLHEAYGSEIDTVTVDDCTFKDLSKKPGMAIGDLNADTTVSITDSTFTNVQPGDQGLYIYETDTDVTTFNFTQSGNTTNVE